MIVQIMIFVAAFSIGGAGNALAKPTPGQDAVGAFAILKLFGYVRGVLSCAPGVSALDNTSCACPCPLQTTFVIFVVLFRDILLPAPGLQEHDQMPPVPSSYNSNVGGASTGGDAGTYGGSYGGTGSGSDSLDSKVTVSIAGGGVL